MNNAVISAVNMSTWLKLDVPSYQSCKNNYTIFGQHTVWSIYLGDVPFRSTGISVKLGSFEFWELFSVPTMSYRNIAVGY